jgi:hypothetical protein
MKRPFVFALYAVASAMAVFGGLTMFALEGSRVAVLETTSPDGELHRTHVWYAESGGELWIESATDERPFFRDIASNPAVRIELRRSGLDRHPQIARGRATIVPDPEGHERIRSMLRETYGWADRWIAMLQDTSKSRAVRIRPDAFDAKAPAAGPGGDPADQ